MLIYHTHNSEGYSEERTSNNEEHNVVGVGTLVAKELEEKTMVYQLFMIKQITQLHMSNLTINLERQLKNILTNMMILKW